MNSANTHNSCGWIWIATVVSFLIFHLPANACSAFCQFGKGPQADRRLVCGDNFDWKVEVGSYMNLSPAGFTKTGITAKSTGNPVKWTAKYSTIYTNGNGGILANRVLNSSGLFGTLHNSNPRSSGTSRGVLPSSLPELLSNQLLIYLGDTAATFVEAESQLKKVRIVDLSGEPPTDVQFLICDPKQCGVIEFYNGELVSTILDRGQSAAYTNDTYKDSIQSLAKESSSGRPKSSLNRFRMLSKGLGSSTLLETPIPGAVKLLNAVAGRGTQWQLIVTEDTLAFRTRKSAKGNRDAPLKHLPLSLLKDRKCSKKGSPETQILTLDMGTPSTGDVANELKPYSIEATTKAIVATGKNEEIAKKLATAPSAWVCGIGEH